MINFQVYVQIFVTAVCAIAYILTFRYQSSKMKVLEQTLQNLHSQITSQSKIISDFEKYKSLFDIEDFEKRLKLKLEIQKDELSIEKKEEIVHYSKEMADIAVKAFQKENEKILNAFQELSQIPITIAMDKYPKKEDKKERDKYLKTNYPHSSEYFIGFCDMVINKTQTNDQI